MAEFLTEWFKWFEKGISGLDEKSKEKFFSECASNCVNRGVLDMYKDLYLESENDLDKFFRSLSSKGFGEGYVIEPLKVYEMSFSRCTCELNNLGYVHSDCICECSRQSIIHVMESLNPDFSINVDKISTILNGDKECRFRVTIT